MALEVEALLAPVSDANAVGADLSYDQARQEIEAVFEVTIGDDAEEAVTDWREVIRRIEAQSVLTKDVWLPVYLARAGARLGDVETVAVGVQYLAGLLETYWDTVHPQLDELGFQGRKGPCESLAQIATFLRPLRRTLLLRHPRLGQFSGADFERFAHGGPDEEGYGMFRAALQDGGDAELEVVLDRLDQIRDGIRRTDAVLTARDEDGVGTNFQPTYDTLSALRSAVASFGTNLADAASDEADAPSAAGGVATGVSGPAFAGRIDSREDVARAIDGIVEYYRRREPGSPVPVLLLRAREWLTADFLTILSDIAPGSLDEVRLVLTKRQKSEY